MTYASEVLADAPSHWWRGVGLPGQLTAWDSGSLKRPLYGSNGGPVGLGNYGVAPDGGSLSQPPNTFLQPYTTDGDLAPAPYTFEEWVWVAATPLLGAMSGQIGTTNQWFHNLGGLTTAPLFTVGDQDVSGSHARSTAGISLRTWYHLVSTHDSTNLRLYLNGALVGTPLACTPHGNPAAGMFVANRIGFFAEIAVYPTALSAARILAHYNAAAAVDPSPTPTVSGAISPLAADLTAIRSAVIKTY